MPSPSASRKPWMRGGGSDNRVSTIRGFTTTTNTCKDLKYDAMSRKSYLRGSETGEQVLERTDQRLSQRDQCLQQPAQASSDAQEQHSIAQDPTKSVFYPSAPCKAQKINIVQYIGIAADEPERIKRIMKPGFALPLVEIGWDEVTCRKWCEENDLLSPIYTHSTRGGCWFCHNQSIDQLRHLRKTYPDLWALLLKWDTDSPVTFARNFLTVHDYDKRFAMEDKGLFPKDKRFLWKMVKDYDGEL